MTLVALREAREKTIAVLSDLFARDELDLEEFEKRVTLVHHAASVADVEKVVADLPGPKGDALVQVKPQPSTAMVAASQVRKEQSIVAVLGGVQREGTWTSAQSLRVVTVLGGAVLDFREARLAPGVTDVRVFAMLGGVQIIVPPELSVDIGGVAIMGGFEHMDRTPLEPDPERPVLRVHGFCIMGGVAVETRLAGEGEREARRRRRRERRARRG